MTSNSSDSQPKNAASAKRHRAFGAMFLAAGLAALASPIVHLSAEGANPFHFNLTLISIEAIILAAVLLISANRYLRSPLHRIDPSSEDHLADLKRPRTYVSFFARPKGDKTTIVHSFIRVRRSRGGEKNLASLLRLPLLWSVVGTLHYGFFAWSTNYIETAIAATVYELWPFFVVVMIARHNALDESYRLGQVPHASRQSNIGLVEAMLLSLGAAIGVSLISMSQYDATSWNSLTWSNSAGLALAGIASILSALWITGTLVYGKTIYYRLVKQSATDDANGSDSWRTLPVNERSRDHRRVLLWSTVAGIVVARLLAIPTTLILDSLVFDNFTPSRSLTQRALIGGMVLGLVGATSATLRRYGDISADGPGIHALGFLTPPLSLMFLWVLGIDLPHRDMFAIGAALIIASNVLIQARPDQHRDLSRFGIQDTAKRGRLGFNAFILAIWSFGTVLYFRDDILPTSWLMWNSGEYWSLIALSATVFALILGFRIVRLAGRIDQEDDITVHLFRDCEHLVRRGHLDGSLLAELRVLDMLQTRKLVDAYKKIREKIREKLETVSDVDDYKALRNAEINLDRLCHTKQQGRDIVELISLSAFALVTISLGLFTRPPILAESGSRWSSFVGDAFTLIFVSTVAFLWVNLFDMRRDRSAPTLVPVPEHDGDYGVFFRYDRDLRVKHGAAVVLSTAMAATFVLLLYGKWLG